MLQHLKENAYTRRALLYVLNILSIINKFVPKNKRNILFYDNSKEYLDDNTEAFYTWLKENGFSEKYKMICCVPMYKGNYTSCNYKPIGILKGIWYYLTSKYVFYSFGDFRIKPSNKQIVVNLWHGTPLKAIGKLTSDGTNNGEDTDNFTYVLSAAEMFRDVFSNAFGCTSDKVRILGHTRNDYLFSKLNTLGLVGIEKVCYRKIVLWMPTFRQSKNGRFNAGGIVSSETMLPILSDFKCLNEFDEYLKSKGVFLVVKIHPLAKFKNIVDLQNIRILTNEDIVSKGVKLYEFVKDFDALITDYSSIYFDYMLLDRPMGFTLDDYETYADKRGFVVDNVLDFMPGHHLYTVSDMENFINDVVKGKDVYKAERQALLPKVCKYSDGNNCKRLAEEVGIK